MKIFEVIAQKVDCEGRPRGNEVLERFTKESDAILYKKVWQDSWERNTTSNLDSIPCWLYYNKDITIKTVDVKEEFNGEI